MSLFFPQSCTVLLGEPGIGKSHSVRSILDAEKKTNSPPGSKFRYFDVRAYGSEERVIRDVFGDQLVRTWASGDGILHLFIDSLDECLLRINTLAAILSEEIRKLPTQRLKLRIACRTADWPKTLEEALKDVWSEEDVNIYEMAPLRRTDVEEALKINRIEPAKFLEAVENIHAVPLAIKPITLHFLVNTYLKTGNLPSNQTQLYLEGCRLLCEETSQSRRDAKLFGEYSADQRLAIAMRVAAITVFANRYAVWIGLDRGNVPDEDVTLQSLSGESEDSPAWKIPVTQHNLREVLGTGLFSSRGIDRMGWAHQTYAEFLAARYLVEHKVPLTQINMLIVYSGDSQGKLVPQISQTAAWLASMVPEVLKDIVARDPEVLVRSDVSTAAAADRQDLVSALLDLSEQDKLIPYDLGIRTHLRKLSHQNLSKQLKPVINDAKKRELTRHLAIDIAEACGVTELSQDLAAVVLDGNQPLQLRINAAHALAQSGDDESRIKMKPFATETLNDDPQDELKGCALSAVWPKFLDPQQLFGALTTPKDSSLFGAYSSFHTRQLPEQLRPSDLPTALAWLEKKDSDQDTFSDLVASIILKAWEHLEEPGLADRLAKTILARIHAYHDLFPRFISRREKKLSQFLIELVTMDSRRRILLAAFLPYLRDPKQDPFFLLFCQPSFVLRQDLTWLIETLKASSDPITKQVLAEIIARIVDWQDRIQLDKVLLACNTEPVLAEVLSWLVKPVELNSPQAEALRKRFQEEKEWEKKAKEKPLLDPPPRERIKQHLESIEEGNIDAWWRLCMDLTLEPTSTHYGSDYESDLTSFPGWKDADIETRRRIVEAAKVFIAHHMPRQDEWLGKKVFPRPDFSGYKALSLLLQVSPEFVETLDSPTWKRWAPVVLAYPTGMGAGKDEASAALIHRANSKAPDEIRSTLSRLIDNEVSEHKQVFITERILQAWDNGIAQVLLEKVRDPNLNPTSFQSLLDTLLSQGSHEARSHCETFLKPEKLSQQPERGKAARAARVLIVRSDDAGWPLIWPLIKQDTDFGKEVIESVSFAAGETGNFTNRLTEKDLGQLFVWLAQQYPYRENTKGGFGFVGPTDTAAILRDSLLHVLKQRGTPQSVKALADASQALPELKWLKFHILEAQNITRQQTWTPPQPAELLALVNNEQARLVQNGRELLDAVIESFNHLKEKLHAETPSVQFLWNEVEKNIWRPRDENSISDFFKIHLDEDLAGRGIIVNREVRIHRGQRTDIHINAVVKAGGSESFDVVTVIIEVKGLWNPELDHAMETQLIGKYLKDNRCQHGLYVIGWFASKMWDVNDNRKTKTPGISLNEAKLKFADQAVRLSNTDVTVRSFVLDATLA